MQSRGIKSIRPQQEQPQQEQPQFPQFNLLVKDDGTGALVQVVFLPGLLFVRELDNQYIAQFFQAWKQVQKTALENEMMKQRVMKGAKI